MLCLFSAGEGRAVAAVFPETGVPELPRPPPPSSGQSQNDPLQPQPPSAGSLPGGLNPNHLRMLQALQRLLPPNLPPEQRNALLAQRIQQLAQAQAQAQANAVNANTGNNPNVNPAPQNAIPAQNQNQASMNAFGNFSNLGGMGGLGLNTGVSPFPSSAGSTSIGGLGGGSVGGGTPQPWSAVSPANAPSGSAGSSASGGLSNMNMGGTNVAQMLAFMRQQQMQGGMGAPPRSAGQQGPFMG